MKKILTLLVFSITAISASAQVTIFPKLGGTISTVTMEDDGGMKSKLGLVLGVGLNFPVNAMFSVQPELQFVQKGFRADKSYTSDSFTLKTEGSYALNYLEIPVLVKAGFGSDNFKFFLNAGPSIGIGLGGKADVDFEFLDGVHDFSTSGTSNVKFGEAPDNYEGDDIYFDNRMDFGVQFGGGFLIMKKVMVDIRYGLGLSNLMKKEDGMTAEEAKSKNRVIQFTVGVPFPMK
jgi:hypothetical protein